MLEEMAFLPCSEKYVPMERLLEKSYCEEEYMNPVLVEVHRKNVVESCHRGSAIVVKSTGETVFSIGNVERNIFPRSALKLFQAIPLIESGAARSYDLTDAEITLACASHNGEDRHTSGVEKWLARLGLSVDDLENGPAFPMFDPAKCRMISDQAGPTRLHQNCSGKHAGMLTFSKYINADTKGYSEYDHASQMTWMNTLSELVGMDVRGLEWERDGCGMPAICMPMERLAYGCALFARPNRLEGRRRQAMSKIVEAIVSAPDMIAGTDRCDTAVLVATSGKVIVKTGAEAVYAGLVPEKRIGFVLKIDDGTPRGSEVALGALLKQIGALDGPIYQGLSKYFRPEIMNSQGRLTGRTLPSDAWSAR